MLIQGSASSIWVALCGCWVAVTTLTSPDGMSTGVRLIRTWDCVDRRPLEAGSFYEAFRCGHTDHSVPGTLR